MGKEAYKWHRKSPAVVLSRAKAKLDIRTWAPDNRKSLKGISLDDSEARKLYEALARIYANN